MTAEAGPPRLGCADAARARGASIAASASRHARFLLVEMPGPWGRSVAEAKYLGTSAGRALAAAAAAADTHIAAIRRPGRQEASGQDTRRESLAWAIADTSAGAQRIAWGSWRDPADLLDIDLTGSISTTGTSTTPTSTTGTSTTGTSTSGPQRLALVCTNGKRDLCCAVYGRPVAAAIAAGTDWDTWECSHLGGHRFAATMMLLPTGHMFGWLDPESAVAVLRRFDAGEVTLPYYRGRSGLQAPVQAALHAAAVSLAEPRLDALKVSWLRQDAHGRDPRARRDLWAGEVVHTAADGTVTAYLVTLAAVQAAPGLLSCADEAPRSETEYETLSFARA
jgi:hypothetical protein